jgi:hypothetical protein
VYRHRIDAARLKTLARGEDDPFAGKDPFAEENRRVQFRGE